MALTIKNVVEEGINRLLYQFQSKPKIVSFLTAILNQVQESEDSKFDLLNGASIYTAMGERLDVCGSIVGEERLGKTDAEYRDAILQRIAINTSNGTPNKLLQILQILTGATVIRLWEHYPANIIFYSNNPTGNMDQVRETLQTASPAAVGNIGVIHDPTGQGFAPAETLYTDILVLPIVNQDGEQLVNQAGDLILAQVVANGTVVELVLVDELGNIIIDEEGNTLTADVFVEGFVGTGQLAEGEFAEGGLLVEYYG